MPIPGFKPPPGPNQAGPAKSTAKPVGDTKGTEATGSQAAQTGSDGRDESVKQQTDTNAETLGVRKWADGNSVSRMIERELRAETKFQDAAAKAAADIGQ